MSGAGPDAPSDHRILRLARFTVPIHLLLPALLWESTQRWPNTLTQQLLVIHALGAVLIAASYRLWRGRGEELAVLILIDHLATGLGGALLGLGLRFLSR